MHYLAMLSTTLFGMPGRRIPSFPSINVMAQDNWWSQHRNDALYLSKLRFVLGYAPPLSGPASTARQHRPQASPASFSLAPPFRTRDRLTEQNRTRIIRLGGGRQIANRNKFSAAKCSVTSPCQLPSPKRIASQLDNGCQRHRSVPNIPYRAFRESGRDLSFAVFLKLLGEH